MIIRKVNTSFIPDTNTLKLGERNRIPRGLNQVTAPAFNATIPVSVTRYFTDVNGTIYDKSLAPAAMQVSYPAFVLGAYDQDGGFKIAQNVLQPAPGVYYLMSFVVGNQLPFPYATGVNTINGQLKPGDIVTVYTDSIDAPSNFVFMVQSIARPNTAGLNSVIKNLRSSSIVGSIIQLYTTNEPQFAEPLSYIQTADDGTYQVNYINPLAFKDPLTQFQNGFIDIRTTFTMSHHFGIVFNYLFSTNAPFSMNFKIKI